LTATVGVVVAIKSLMVIILTTTMASAMTDTTSPTNAPANTNGLNPTTSPQSIPSTTRSSHLFRNLLMIVGGLFLLMVVGVVSFYLGRNRMLSLHQSKPLSSDLNKIGSGEPCNMDTRVCPDGSSIGRVGPNCDFAKCPSGDTNQENWTTYTDSTFHFRYPSSWMVESGSEETEAYFGGDVVSILSPSDSVSIIVNPGRFPYGFGASNGNIPDGEVLNLKINGEAYAIKENVRVENGVTKVFVDFQVQIGEREYTILFGTGYPVNNDEKASSSDYYLYREEIIDILNTLQISDSEGEMVNTDMKNATTRISPDGRYKLWLAGPGHTGLQMWISNIDESEMRLVTRGEGESNRARIGDFSLVSPVWSPDNGKIAYFRAVIDHIGEYDVADRLDLYVVNRDGSNDYMVKSNIVTRRSDLGQTDLQWNQTGIRYTDFSSGPSGNLITVQP